MDELLEQFLLEGRDLVAQASSDLATLATSAGNARTIDSAFRAIHTLKGSVGIFPLGPAERVLHRAEDILSHARATGGALDADVLASLVAVLDAVDRWIDALETNGGVEPDADRVAAVLLARLDSGALHPPVVAEDSSAVQPDWAATLSAPLQDAARASTVPLVAFRYTPDPDCFLRGEDPLAIVSEVPALTAIAIAPVGETWPPLETFEPFVCDAIFSGLSAAPLDAVRSAFRLVVDQVALTTLDVEGPTAIVDESAHTGVSTTLRVESARIDALADGLGQLVVAMNGFGALTKRADMIDRELARDIRVVQASVERVAADLHRHVSAVRLVPLAPALRRLPRLVREIAQTLERDVEFRVVGDALEVDKQIADGVFEPLVHIIRNAIDHGIEPPAERLAAGKDRRGSIALSATRDGDAIVLTIEDDGAGIDVERVRATALRQGILDSDTADQLSEAAILQLIFAPGFSTATEVTGVSGRGVGMDAVQAAVEHLRGTVEITSAQGKGTRVGLRFPANALTTRLLVVEAGGDRYGVALDQVVETVRIDTASLMPLGSGQACVLRGRTVPVLGLAEILGRETRPLQHAKLLVTRTGGELVAVRVDGFATRVDTVVRPSSGLLARVPGVTGSTLLGDGEVLLVLDLPALAA